MLGYYEEEKLIYVGKVGTGFTHETSFQMHEKLEKLKIKQMPFSSVTAMGRRGAIWVDPETVCEVEFTEWTEDGHLRHPSYQGLREDKKAFGIKRDEPLPVEEAIVTSPKSSKKGDEVSGIRISHPDRVIFPGSGLTKLDLAKFYESISDRILPQIINRPISMLRCPEGTAVRINTQPL